MKIIKLIDTGGRRARDPILAKYLCVDLGDIRIYRYERNKDRKDTLLIDRQEKP